MANTIVTPTWTMKEVARRFVNMLTFSANVNRSYDDSFSANGTRVGYTVNARLPQRFQVTEGQALQLQNLNNQTVPISLTHQKNIAFGWSSADRTMLIEEVRERYVNPAGEALANIVDWDGLNTVTKDVYHSIGTPGTTPNTNLTYLQAGAKLTNLAVPMGGRMAVLDATAQITLANANQTIFGVPQGSKSDMWTEGQFSDRALGIDKWMTDQNIWREVYGTYSGTPVVNGAGQTGSTIVTSGWGAGVSSLNKGDTFTMAGVYAINPMNYSSVGSLQDFVVTSTVSDVAGAMTINFAPSIITSGQLQTVDTSPANNAAITVRGASGVVSPQSLIYLKDAFALVFADLHKPTAGAIATSVQSKGLGVSIRMVEQYQIGTDQEPTRLDILYGWATIRPQMAVRVQS